MPDERKPYLLLLQQPSQSARREAARQVSELGAVVVAQFGRVAVEVLATEAQMAAISAVRLFSARLKGRMKAEHMEKQTPEQIQVISLWNARFTPGYRKLKKDLTHVGKPWNAPGLSEPLPYSAIDPEDFRQLVARYEERTGRTVTPEPPRAARTSPARRAAERQMSATEFTEYEKRLAEIYKNPQLAYHLARLAYRLGRR